MSIERLGEATAGRSTSFAGTRAAADSTRRKRTFDRRRDAELFEASIRRARQLGQLASEVIGSNATLEEFLVEWWDTYAATHLRPNTLATYTTLLDKWIVPYLGRKRLREINRETIDIYAARLRVDGAGAPTINRTLGVLQGVFHRAVEWRRLGWNPVVGVRRLAHTRAETIDARTPETVEAIRRQLDPQNAALVSVLAYEGLRPGEAYALVWGDVMDDSGQAAQAAARAAGDLGRARSRPRSRSAAREPELFKPVASELVELYLAARTPAGRELVVPEQPGRPPPSPELAPPRLDPGARARRASLLPQLRPPPHLRDAPPLRGPNAERGRRAPRPRRPRLHRPHLRARHARRPERRRITISEAIRRGRVAASRRPLVDPSDAEAGGPGTPSRRRSPCKSREPTRGLEPGTPSLRVKCSTS